MRTLTMLVCLVAAGAPLSAAAQSVEERPVSASTAYRQCAAGSSSQAGQRACLASEVERANRALADTVVASGVDAKSQELWSQSTAHDCQAEYDMAGGGNSADMRQMACVIEQTAARSDYLLRRGNW